MLFRSLTEIDAWVWPIVGPSPQRSRRRGPTICHRSLILWDHQPTARIMSTPRHRAHRRWRDYRTASSRSPVGEFIMKLPLDDRAAVVAAMKDVKAQGNAAAHHLRGEIYEVRARARTRQFRILFATEGRSEQILLALHIIAKKTRTVSSRDIALADQRLRDWRSRSRPS